MMVGVMSHRKGRRGDVVLGLVLACGLLVWHPRAFALDRSLDASQCPNSHAAVILRLYCERPRCGRVSPPTTAQSISRGQERPFQELLQYFAMERFLYRLSKSPSSDRFILNGALC